MNFCRSLYRRWFLANRKAERKNEKKLRRGSVHNLLTSSLQKILMSAAGLTMFAAPLLGATQSQITALGNQTTISYDEAKKLHTITTTKIQGQNAFNAFKSFTLHSNEIANLVFPNNTQNLLNFVNSKIDIQGTLNAVRNSKIGGNLYFLSSEGLILGKGGVINAGAFYAMTPTKDFMNRFINESGFVSSVKDYDVNLILDKKIGNYNVAKSDGVIIDTYGSIKIYGKINTINGIGLYAGGTNSDEKTGVTADTPIVIGNYAELNTLTKDQLQVFSNLVNVEGINIPRESDLILNRGNIELVSVQDNTHYHSTVVEKITSYTKLGSSPEAYAKVEVDGSLKSRGDINIQSYASNGAVSYINSKGEKSFGSNNKLSKVISEISFSGNAVAGGNITLEATADNENTASTINVKDFGLSISGGSVGAFPLNVNVDVLYSKTKSKVDVKQGSVLDAKLALKIDAIINASQQQGTQTAVSVSKNVEEKSKLGRYLPSGASVYAESDNESIVNFDGKAISRAESINKDEASISLRSESNSELDISATAKTNKSLSPTQISLAIGKQRNKATLTIGEHASFETKQDVEIVSETNSENYVEAASKGNRAEYVIPAVGISLFDSDSTVNIEKVNINLNDQKDSFTIKAINNILGDELYAEAGITSPYPWEDAASDAKNEVIGTFMEKFKINDLMESLFGPDNKPVIPKPKPLFNLTGAVAYGGGSHNSKIKVKPGAKIITSGDLVLDSKTYIHDTKYDATSYNYPETEDEDNPSAKAGLGLAILVSDYDYNSKIIFDDSTTSAKTQFVGNSVAINSKVEQPYNRIKVLIDAIKKTALKLKDFFTKDEHKEICDDIVSAASKMSKSNSGVFGNMLTLVLRLKDLLMKETIGDDGMIKRLMAVLENALAFKDYTNYLNYTVSSYVNSSDGDTKLDFAGSVFVGFNKAKSNLFIGKNTVINSQGDGDDRNISLNSKTDITNTSMAGGVPLIAQNISGEEAVSIGGSAIMHTNDSVSELLVADSAKIGSENTEKLSITSDNNFNPEDIIIGASSASTGFNIMASVVNGDSKANVLIDNSVNLSADTLKLYAYNNTTADNIVGSIMLTDKVGVGVGVAVTSLTKEAQVLYDDNDLYWQKTRKELGLRTTDPSNSEVSYSVATITADIVEAVAKTTGTINSIGVAGSVAIDDMSKYNKISNKATMFNDFATGSTLNTGFEYLKYKLAGKILGVNNQNQNVPNAQAQQQNIEHAHGQGDVDGLRLSANGSVGVNKIKNTTKVDLNKANIKFNNKSNAKVDVYAINSAHHLSFAGAAGLIAQGGSGQGTTVGVDGSVALNLLNNETTSIIRNSNIYDSKQINTLSINGGESIAAGLGLQVITSSHDSDSAGSGAINSSVNLIDNKVSAKISETNSSSLDSANKTNLAVTAYEADTQVTGGISAAVGKQKGGVGLSIDVAKINNELNAEVDCCELTQMKNVEVNALQASTIVNAGIAAAVSAGVVQGSFVFSGAGVYTELKNTTNANINGGVIFGDSISVKAQDVRRSDEGVKTYEDNLVRNDQNLDFIEKDGKEFYTGLDTATGTTELGKLVEDRKGSFIFTGSISGAYGGTAVGLGAAINEVDNSFNVNVEKVNIKVNKFEVNAISYTNAIALGIGASVSTEAKKGSGVGSAAWNSIKNKANIKISNSIIKSDSLNLKSLNDSSLVGVGGQFSASKGYAAVGASVSYNSIENTAGSELYGGSVTGNSANTSKLSVYSENTSNIWGVSVSVEKADKVAVGGTVVINEIENNATSAVGRSSKDTRLASLKELNILATDSADIKGLSGAVTASKKVSLGGAVTVNHINGETAAKLNRANFNALNSKIKAYSESNNLSLALGCGGTGTFAFDGAAVNNDIFRDVYVNIDRNTIDNTNGTLDTSAIAIGNTGSLAAVVLGAGNVSIGAGVSVNRMGGKVQSTLNNNNFKIKDLSSTSYSNQDITTIGIAGSGAGVSISGSIAYNAIAFNTLTEVLNNSLISATNNIAIKALSDDTIKNYAGVLSLGIGIPTEAPGAGGLGNGGAVPGVGVGAAANRNKFLKIFEIISAGLKSGHDKMGTISNKMGGVGVGVSVSVNKIDGKTNARVSGGNVTAQSKDANNKVKLKSQIDNSDINTKYFDSSIVDLKSSLADKRKEVTKTGLIVDASSTHTTKSFLASISGSGKAGANANVNVNYIGGETNASFENATINKGLNGNTAGNINVNATDYTNTAGFIGNVSFGGTAGIGLSADTNKVVRTITSKVSGIKEGSVAKNLEVKAISKQGISSVVAGLAASLQVGVAGNVDVAILNSTTKALVENSKISVNSLDVEANHYARAHEMAAAVGIGVGTAGVGAAVVVNNDINTVVAGVASSTINVNAGSNGAFKVNSKNDDDFETITGAGGGGAFAGVAGAVAVDYMENNVETNVATSTFGTSTNRAGSIEIKSKDVSKQVSNGGSLAIGGYAGVGAVVEVNTLDGQTNTIINNSKLYSKNNIDLGASEQRDSDQFAVSVSGGLAGVGANVLVINSGKKLDVTDSGSKDANNDINSAMNMADTAATSDYLGDNYYKGAFTTDEINTIFKGTPSYTASKDGKAVTLTKIDKSIIDSKSGKIISLTTATGSLTLSNNGGAAGAGGVMGTFGYIYDNKNVVTNISNSTIKANQGIDYTSSTYGNSDLYMFQGSAGIGDYSGAFAYVNLSGKNSVGVAGSTLTNTNGLINLKSLDYASAKTEASGFTAGAVAVGTIIAKAKNNSSTDVTIGKSKITSSNTSGSINILSEKWNSLEAIGHGYGGGLGEVTVIFTLAQDNGSSTVKLDTGNTFKAIELSASANNNPNMKSSFTARTGAGLGVGIGDVTTREYGSSKLIAQSGSRYDVGTVNLSANMSSTSNEESSAHTYSLVDIKANRVDSLSSSKVDVIVNIGKNNYNTDSILNVSANNKANAKMSVDGQSGGVVSIANSLASATANLTTNVTITGAGDSSKLGEINAASSSEAEHRLYANGDGGGLINVSPYCAEVDSTMNLTTNTKLAGSLSASNTKVAAVGRGKSYTTTHAYQGSVTGGSGVQTNTNINANTKVLANDNLKLTGESIKLVSLNDFITGPERENANNNGRAYGGITGNSVIGRETINGTSEVNIGKKASLIADKELTIDAKTSTNLSNIVRSGGAGVGIHIGSEGDYNITLNNNIVTAVDSLLKTEDENADVDLATSYDFNAYYLTLSEVFGSGGGSTKGINKYNITTNNKMDLSGDIYSYRDINMFTDRDTNRVSSKYNLRTESECYTKSVIAWETDPELIGSLKLNNNININSSSTLRSIRHSRFFIGNGDFTYNTHTKRYTWYNDEDKDTNNKSFVTVAEGVKNGDVQQNTSLKVDGKVITGVHKDINIKIDGKVSFDKKVTGSGIVYSPTISCSIDEYKNLIKYGSMEYGNKLFERYQQLEKLCQEYSGTIVGLNYEAEKTRLQNEMKKYGLYDEKNNSAVGKLNVDYVELPDMISSGGNIYIKGTEAKNITGKGTLKAQGAPKIQIENNSNLYMIVNDLKILEPGGDIILNDLALEKKAKETINAVTNVETDASTGSLIEVKENWKNSYDVKYKNPDTGKIQDIKGFTPLTNLEINGNIVNTYGLINFYNANKDIVLQGKTANDSASVNGRQISISAPNGSIAQGYTQGITNIGYSPEYLLRNFAITNGNSISKGVTSNATYSKTLNLTEEDMLKYIEEYKKSPEGINDSSSGVWLSGGIVYLNGDDINVNGTIQSGYSQFEVTLTESDKSRIDAIKKQYENARKPEVTDSYLKENCRINENGMKWDSDAGSYKYVVQAYYNPQTDSIVLEDVKSDGGKIYLTGRISNTGNGKIIAADGSSDISIVNKTGKNLIAKTLDTGDRKGLISITDLGKTKDNKGNSILGTLTEMTSDSTKVWYLTSKGKSDKPNKSSGLSSVYNPQSGLSYNWTTGYDTIDEFRYDTSYKFVLWGLVDYGEQTSNTLKEKIKKNQISPNHLEDKSKLPGTFVGNPDVDVSKGYNIFFSNNVDYKDGPRTGGRTDYNDIFHCTGTQYQWAIMKQGATEVFQHSIKADYPIAIKFLKGNGNINVTTNSNLSLDSDVTSKYGKVYLTSSNGFIEQFGGNIVTDYLWLKSTSGIGSTKAINQQMNSKNGVLSAITNSGDINLVSLNQAGLKNADLKFTATTDNGNINVIADASLLKGGNALDVKGSRIDLVSNYGSLGKSNALLNIYAGQVLAKPGDSLSASVNATALGDVALNQNSEDMRIGKIISKTGDVYLTSAGAILDALPSSDTEVQSQSSERLIEKWKQMGIISDDGSDNSSIKKQETLNNYKTVMNVSFQRYLDLNEYFAHNNDTSSELYTEFQKLKEKFGNFTSLDKWLEAQNKDKNSDWYRLQNNTFYGWDQDSLLYAIQDSIINREEGSTVTPKTAADANIKGKNVYIKAGGGIGRDEGYYVVDISDFKSAKGLESLKKIAAAEASDVKWGYNGDKVDKNKATINSINSLAIDSKGTLEAHAKGNIYLEDVNNNAINLISVSSEEGNVRVYGNNGVYNATKYVEGNKNNVINVAGKDLIVEAGKGSIGSSKVPVTTNMSGFVTARSDGLINLYQIGGYALTFAAAYSGADINIRAISNIYSVYNGVQADELGYINAKGNIDLLSDKGDIGQSNGKGLRVKLAEGKVLNAEADSIYIKGYGDNKNINLGKIKARKGNIGLDSKLWDVFLKNNISANNIELLVRSLTQVAGTLTVNKLLKVIAENGILLANPDNIISEAYLYNSKKGNISLDTKTDIILHRAENNASDGNLTIFSKGAVNALEGMHSLGNLFVRSNGIITSKKDIKAEKWMGLYADNGGININGFLNANAVDLSADKNMLTAKGINSNTYIKANVESGNIIINGDIKATEGSIDLVTESGDIKFDNVEAKEDIKVASYLGNKLEFNTINSKEGSVETVSFGSIIGDWIKAGKELFVDSFGDIKLHKIEDGLSVNNYSFVTGNNINIDTIKIHNNFDLISDTLFANNIKTYSDTNLDVISDVDIIKIDTDGDLNINSSSDVQKSYIYIDDINVSNGNLSITNENGDIKVERIKDSGDVYLSNLLTGDIRIANNITTLNGGSLYINLDKGNLYVESGVIDGETSIYSDDGDVHVLQMTVKDELDVRAKRGYVSFILDINVGKDATLISDSNDVLLATINVNGNLSMAAKKQALLDEAVVKGSMQMKGDEVGCSADTLQVGKDLVINSQNGSISLENAIVGENTFISIDSENGGNIDINNIKTGNGSVGDLIITSNSLKIDENEEKILSYIKIDDAVAANKLIINSRSNIELNSAYALNGKLEVKAAGDIVAKLIESAKETYISTLMGLINIKKVISGGSLIIDALTGGIQVEDIVTLDPDADIELIQLSGDLKVSNASSSRDLKFTTLKGNVYVDNIYAGNDINLKGGLLEETDFSIKNSVAGNDLNIVVGKGKIDIANTNIGNDLNVSFTGEMNANDIKVGKNINITTTDDSISNFNRIQSDGFNIKDAYNSSLIFDNSKIGYANFELGGNTSINDSTFNTIDGTIGGFASIINSEVNIFKSIVGGNTTIEKSRIDNFNSTVGGDLKVNNLVNSQLSTVVSGNAVITNLTSDDVTATIKKDAVIDNSKIAKLYANISGNANITNLTSDDITAQIGGNADISDSKIGKMNAGVKGDTTISNVENSELTANISGKAELNKLTVNTTAKLSVGNDATITDSTIGSLDTNIGCDFKVNNLVNSCSSIVVNGSTNIANLTSEDVTASINKDASIDNSKIAKLNAEIGGNAKITNLTSEDITAQIGCNANITDSKIVNMNAEVGGDLTVNNLTNSQMSAVVDGKAYIDTLKANKLTTLTAKKGADITNSKIDSLKADVSDTSLIKDSEFNAIVINNNGEAVIKDSTVNTLTAANSGNFELTSTPVNVLDLINKSGATGSIHDTKVNSITATNDGEININNLTGDQLQLTNNSNSNISVSTIKSIKANNSSELEVNNLTSDNLELTSKGNTNISDSEIKSLNANSSGILDLISLNSNKLELTTDGNTTISGSNIANINANISGTIAIDKLDNNKMSAVVSGKSEIYNSDIEDFNLINSGVSYIENNNITSFKANNSKELTVSSLTGDNFELSSKGNTNITESEIKAIKAEDSGKLFVNKLTGNKLDFTSSGEVNIEDSKIANIDANVSGNAAFSEFDDNKMTEVISVKSKISNSTISQLNMSNTGESTIIDSTVNQMSASNDGNLKANNINSDKFDLTSSGNTNISNSNIQSINAKNSGKLDAVNIKGNNLVLTSSGNTKIVESEIKSININNSGDLDTRNITSDYLVLTNSGNNEIVESEIKSINSNNSGKLDVSNITSDKLVLTSSGKVNIADSNIINLKANNSGKAEINKLVCSQMSFVNSGSSCIKESTIEKMNYNNSGETRLNKININNSANIVNSKGSLNINNLDIANNFDIDSNSGSINMSGINIKNDFNFALAGNSGVKFKDIIIGHDFNVYAGKAVLNGASLTVGNNMKTFTYSKYSAPKANLRAAVSSNNGTARASESDEGFTLILDQLNIGGGLYVDNPDVTIKVKESTIGKDVDIDAGKENIQIDKLDVDGGNLDINGSTGSVKLGEVTVDNDTKISLGSGNLEVSDLNSKQEIDFRVGGNITSDKNIETQNKSVNMVAGGNVDAYKVLAKQQGNIEAVNGDIIIGQINAKTLVFKQDTNDRSLRIREANVETSFTAGSDNIDIDLINQTLNNDRLKVDFTSVIGRAMDNVVIRDIKTEKGVNMFNLISTYGNIHVSNENFNLVRTYLLKKGDLSNSKLKFRLYGYNPIYSDDVDIIAFFAPMINHKSFADISFTNEWHPSKQDYYPLIANGDYKRMFNQYTIVDDFETLRLAYEERIEVLNNSVNGRFDYRKLNNSKAFYVDYGYGISSEGESVNLDEVEIPVGLEYDYASGELKSVGSQVKPQRAVD